VVLGRQHFEDDAWWQLEHDAWRQFEAEAWQQFAACPEFVAAVWHVGPVVVLVVVTIWQVVCCAWQHWFFDALQHLIFAGLQQVLLASAAPLKAARTARVTLSATNFHRLRLMLSPFQL
jgi:hypothetical protein